MHLEGHGQLIFVGLDAADVVRLGLRDCGHERPQTPDELAGHQDRPLLCAALARQLPVGALRAQTPGTRAHRD